MGSMGMSGQRFSNFRAGGDRFRGNIGGRYAGRFDGGRVRRFDGGRFEGQRFRGRTTFYHGKRGYWRGGRWFPLVGFGLYEGGSCYWNCREQGYGPGYCRVNAYDFCY
jgi:hypothetical protein